MLALLFAANAWFPDSIDFVDSEDPKAVILILDGKCSFKMAKSKRYDIDAIEAAIDEHCGYKLKLSEKYGKSI